MVTYISDVFVLISKDEKSESQITKVWCFTSNSHYTTDPCHGVTLSMAVITLLQYRNNNSHCDMYTVTLQHDVIAWTWYHLNRSEISKWQHITPNENYYILYEIKLFPCVITVINHLCIDAKVTNFSLIFCNTVRMAQPNIFYSISIIKWEGFWKYLSHNYIYWA